MVEALRQIFADHGIEYAEAIPFSECSILYQRKVDALPFVPRSVIIFAIPYYAGEFSCRNLSRYAVAKDYHRFFHTLANELEKRLTALYPNAHSAAFADNSPIDEREAAAKAGLGLRGQNKLLITEKYASYVFVGEILTDLSYDEIGTLTSFVIKDCEGCGLCLAACPKKELCLSALTQKKGSLTETEQAEIISLGSAWGCDACQEACPHAKTAEITPIAYFKEDLIPCLSAEDIVAMPDDLFAERAYSWRGKQTILRNLLLLK